MHRSVCKNMHTWEYMLCTHMHECTHAVYVCKRVHMCESYMSVHTQMCAYIHVDVSPLRVCAHVVVHSGCSFFFPWRLWSLAGTRQALNMQIRLCPDA